MAFALLLLDFGVFPALLTRLQLAVVATLEFGGTAFGAVLLRLEALFVLTAFRTAITLVVAVAFGLERLAALVFATVLVAPVGTVLVFLVLVAGIALAVPPATRVACRLGLLKRPSVYRFRRLSDEFQHLRRGGGHLDRLDFQSGLVQHATGSAALVRQHDGHHVAGMAGAGGTSGTVQEGFRILRRLHLHDEFDAGDVDASGRDVSGHHDVHVAGFEGREIAVTLVLAQVSVQFRCRDAVLSEILGEFLRLEFGSGEQDPASLARCQGTHQGVAVALRGLEHMVGHLVDRRGGGVDAVHLRIGEERVHDLVHAMVQRGGEQHDLRVERHLAEQSFDRRQEAHVGHFIGLVDDGDLDLLQGQRMLFDQVLEASGACDNDIGAGPEVANLAGVSHSAVHGGGVDAVDLRKGHQHVVDLVGELTRRGEHEATRMRNEILRPAFLGVLLLHAVDLMAELAHVLEIVGVHLAEAGDQRNRERERLSGAGASTTEDVAGRQGIGKRVRLDREGGFLIVRREDADQRTGNAQFRKRLGTFLFLAHFIEVGGEGIYMFIQSGIGHNGLSCQTLRTLRKLYNDTPRPLLSMSPAIRPEYPPPLAAGHAPETRKPVRHGDGRAESSRIVRSSERPDRRGCGQSTSGSSLAMVPVALPMALRPW